MAPKITILGGGAWGTALATVACRAGAQTMLWAREDAVVTAINVTHENSDFLPDVPLPPALAATSDMAAALAGADLALLVVPTQHIRAALPQLTAALAATVPLVICAKGIEQDSGLLPSALLTAALPDTPMAVLSGPTFAREVAMGLPTAVTLAASNPTLARSIAQHIGLPHFRPYLSDDLVGAQVGGAVKNVIAIACGIVTGLGLGDNARAALITRGLSEIGRLSAALGGTAETVMGLSGLGDLTLTCGSRQSRNMSLGCALAEGTSLADILASRRSVAEGVWTARSIARMAQEKQLDMPICRAVDAILHGDMAIEQAIAELLARPFTSE